MSDVPRYWLLAGRTCYPSEGWEDLCGSFDTVEEAKKDIAKGKLESWGRYPCDWAQILDRETMTVILRGESDGYARAAPWEWEEARDE